jgi:hypothetical protein
MSRNAVTITETWDLEMIRKCLSSTRILQSEKVKLRDVLTAADSAGNVDVTYRCRNGHRTQTPVHIAKFPDAIQRLCCHKYMRCLEATFPDGSKQDVFFQRGTSQEKITQTFCKLVRHWRSDRASDISPYPQGICATCPLKTHLKRCDGCKIVQYCSREHQREHWTDSHRHECSHFYNILCTGDG